MASKQLFVKEYNKYNEIIFLVLSGLMFLGFLEARALLSIGAIGLLIYAFLPFNYKHTIINIKNNKFVILSILFFFLHIVSFLWSQNKHEATEQLIIKLSFLALPTGMMCVSRIRFQYFMYFIYIINIALFIICLKSTYIYVTDFADQNEAYMLYTTRHADHIRFSLAVVLVTILNIFSILKIPNQKLWKKLIIGLLTMFYAAFLHILSARTGLLCFYAAIGILALYFSWKKSPLWSLATIIAFVILIIGAVNVFPRLENKVNYIKYELTQWNHNHEDESIQYTLSDNNRILSYDVAWESIKQHPILGVGMGDVQDEMVRLYKEMYPKVPEEGILKLPHNQLLSSAMSLGLLGPIFLLLFIIFPIKQAQNHKVFVFTTFFILLLAYFIDAYLEVQLGCYLFLYFSTLWTILSKSNT